MSIKMYACLRRTILSPKAFLPFNPLIDCTAQAVTTVTTVTEYMTLGTFVVNRVTPHSSGEKHVRD